jgi:UDP-N-acetylglucosamine--N-acetylmuramyl-(pentapeptide) pyrophosphoryl-undecaprenol N-acetylglucosamine transferase
MAMHIAVACGGTGGHIFPGLATARVLQKRGNEVSLWLGGRDVENLSVLGWQGKVITVKAEGFPPAVSLRWFTIAIKLLRSIATCRGLMKQNRPDVVLAMGSYASVGPVWAAHSLGIPVVLHEANAVPGRAVSLLSRWASVVAVAFEPAAHYFRHRKVVVTGLPVREVVKTRLRDGLEDGRFTVLVMGGSQGAHKLNEIASAAISRVHRSSVAIQVVHLTGPRDESWVRGIYAEKGVTAVVFGFLKEMGEAYNVADLAIARSGAASCVELAAYGVPALFVPLPLARRDHQTANAKVFVEAGAAEMVAEKDLSAERLAEYVNACMTNRVKLDKMKTSTKNAFVADAAEKLADLVVGQAR